jgi:hypothetical protein
VDDATVNLERLSVAGSAPQRGGAAAAAATRQAPRKQQQRGGSALVRAVEAAERVLETVSVYEDTSLGEITKVELSINETTKITVATVEDIFKFSFNIRDFGNSVPELVISVPQRVFRISLDLDAGTAKLIKRSG